MGRICEVKSPIIAGCTMIRTEQVSGKSRDGRGELKTLLGFIRDGDVRFAALVCCERTSRGPPNFLLGFWVTDRVGTIRCVPQWTPQEKIALMTGFRPLAAGAIVYSTLGGISGKAIAGTRYRSCAPGDDIPVYQIYKNALVWQ
jgi:hypothetical protein